MNVMMETAVLDRSSPFDGFLLLRRRRYNGGQLDFEDEFGDI